MAKERNLVMDAASANFLPGSISCCQCDCAGVNYGMYQFASRSGAPQSFVGYLNKKGHPYGRMLTKFAAGTREFSCCWQYIGEHDPKEFERLQHEFVNASYFLPVVERLREEFAVDLPNSASEEFKDLIWLLALEFGPAQTIDLFRGVQAAAPLPLAKLTEEDLVAGINGKLAAQEWVDAKEQILTGIYAPVARGNYLKKEKLGFSA